MAAGDQRGGREYIGLLMLLRRHDSGDLLGSSVGRGRHVTGRGRGKERVGVSLPQDGRWRDISREREK